MKTLTLSLLVSQASYWQSQETKQVLEEEDALRSAIFCQMLAASS